MRARVLAGYLGTLGAMAFAFLLYSIPSLPTVSARTVIGYAVPNAASLGYGVPLLILPIIIGGLFVGLGYGLSLEGYMGSFLLKLGLLIGCIVGMLSVTSSAPLVVPLAFTLAAATYFITYLWKRV
jgi:hypothetical protein